MVDFAEHVQAVVGLGLSHPNLCAGDGGALLIADAAADRGLVHRFLRRCRARQGEHDEHRRQPASDHRGAHRWQL
jgi:hypothetical protein